MPFLFLIEIYCSSMLNAKKYSKNFLGTHLAVFSQPHYLQYPMIPISKIRENVKIQFFCLDGGKEKQFSTRTVCIVASQTSPHGSTEFKN
jgi:hypothetical protein